MCCDMNSPGRIKVHRKFWGLQSSPFHRARALVQYAALLGALTVVVVAFGDIESGFVPEPEDPAIAYGTQPTRDRISALNYEIEAGRAQLKFDGAQGYLRSALDALHIPIESQMAVFSKTSVQARLIDPRNPRTLFFDDSVVVGWVRGGFIEVAAQDPQQGVDFLHPRPDARREATIHAPRRLPTVPQFQQRNGYSGHVGAQPIHSAQWRGDAMAR